MTLHRAENVDVPERLKKIFDGFTKIADKYEKDILVSVHPRTEEKMSKFGISVENRALFFVEIATADAPRPTKSVRLAFTVGGGT